MYPEDQGLPTIKCSGPTATVPSSRTINPARLLRSMRRIFLFVLPYFANTSHKYQQQRQRSTLLIVCKKKTSARRCCTATKWFALCSQALEQSTRGQVQSKYPAQEFAQFSARDPLQDLWIRNLPRRTRPSKDHRRRTTERDESKSEWEF